jgi:hypothetical protein
MVGPATQCSKAMVGFVNQSTPIVIWRAAGTFEGACLRITSRGLGAAPLWWIAEADSPAAPALRGRDELGYFGKARRRAEQSERVRLTAPFAGYGRGHRLSSEPRDYNFGSDY